MIMRLVVGIFAACVAAAAVCRADIQVMSPGTGQQNLEAVNTGVDGICASQAAAGDLQVTPVGQGAPHQVSVLCGDDRVPQTTAVGDDRQLIAVNGYCVSNTTAVIDTGANGVADTAVIDASDDVQSIGQGISPPYAPCVLVGANGIADTIAEFTDDQVLPYGTGAPNAPVVLCGPNGLAETTANNVDLAGDDVQIVLPGQTCIPGATLVDSGANGLAESRAEGPDFAIAAGKPVRIKIGSDHTSVSKTVKVKTTNLEFGALAPTARMYRLVVENVGCPPGTVSQIDADVTEAGLQAIALVGQGKSLTGSFVVTFRFEDVTSVSSKSPFRCVVKVSASSEDTNGGITGILDDARPDGSNSTWIDFGVIDRNDL